MMFVGALWRRCKAGAAAASRGAYLCAVLWLLPLTAPLAQARIAPAVAPLQGQESRSWFRSPACSAVEACGALSEAADRPNALPVQGASDSSAPSYWTVLASAAVPGSGQALLSQRRFVAYLAFEAIAWTRYDHERRQFRAARARYRRLAADIARTPFSATRPDGDFSYYESMLDFSASGVYDVSADEPFDPEVDETTFNGAIWLLARQTYWASPTDAPGRDSPEWARAERFYRQRAVRPDFRWSWRGADAAYARFRQGIRESNNASRDAVNLLGLMLANHVLSTVDAFVTVRLRRRGEGLRQQYQLGAEFPLGGQR